MPQPTDVPQSQNCLAKALYDNVADSPDELEFRRGDTLVVLEQNTANIEGWWLCSLRGRQGICPANRLRLIPGVYQDTGSRVASPQFEYPNDIYHLQRQGKRRSWHIQPNQVVTPKKYNDVYLYDTPPRCSPMPAVNHPPVSNVSASGDCYDVPPRAIPVSNDNFRNCPRCSPAPPSCPSPTTPSEAYDVPRSLSTLSPNPLTPSTSTNSLTNSSLASSNRSSLATMPDYDVPRPFRPKELPLELNSALETLERLEADTTAAVGKLLGFVGPRWRSPDRLEANLMEIRLYVTRLRASLHDLAEFGEGALGNAARASDKNLAGKLSPLVMAVRKSEGIVRDAVEKLDACGWSLEVLAREEEKGAKPDELEQLVACSRALTEDIRQIASFIQGNGLLLFRKEQEEYDYVSLESKESIARGFAVVRKELPEELVERFDECVSHADDVAFEAGNEDDRHLLEFFTAQLVTHHRNLTQAIDAFLLTVEHNQPPKVFLAHGKFVVLSAHKLVHIADTVSRNVSCKGLKDRSLSCANALSDALATSVAKTKNAALQFPSVSAVQDMVDSVVDISHYAKDLKLCLMQAAGPP